MAKIFNKKDDIDNEEGSVISENGQQVQQQPDPLTEESQKLNAVRELLFGQNVKEYRDEFDELKKLIKDHKKDFERENSDLKNDVLDRIDKMDEKFNNRLDDSIKSINDKLDKLNDDKADRKKMASVLHSLASQLED